MKLEMGSARKIPLTPRPKTVGRNRVSGITMIAFRSSEKKIACFDLPRAMKTVWPENCSAIIKNPKK